MHRLIRLAALAIVFLKAGPGHAQPMLRLMTSLAAPHALMNGPVLSPGAQCRMAIRAAERRAGIPFQLMAAIGRVESGRPDASGHVDPWPWSIDAEGVDHVYESKAAAIAAVRSLQATGVRSIDVGCMQVNLMYHPDAFATLDDAFDPGRNAQYAARLLGDLREQTGNWQTATAWYHSATPELGADYERRVMDVWPEEQRHAGFEAGTLTVSPTAGAGGSAFGVGLGRLSHAPALPGSARILALKPGAMGRTLAAYRAAPIGILAAARPGLR